MYFRDITLVATRKLIQHLLPKMGHKSLLVTQTVHGLKGGGGDRRCSGLVQRRRVLRSPRRRTSWQIGRREFLATTESQAFTWANSGRNGATAAQNGWRCCTHRECRRRLRASAALSNQICSGYCCPVWDIVVRLRPSVELNNNSAYSAMPTKRLAAVSTRQLCAILPTLRHLQTQHPKTRAAISPTALNLRRCLS